MRQLCVLFLFAAACVALLSLTPAQAKRHRSGVTVSIESHDDYGFAFQSTTYDGFVTPDDGKTTVYVSVEVFDLPSGVRLGAGTTTTTNGYWEVAVKCSATTDSGLVSATASAPFKGSDNAAIVIEILANP